jgi:hypothetical protein
MITTRSGGPRNSRRRTRLGRSMKMTMLALMATATVAATSTGSPIASAEPADSPVMAAHGVEAPLGAVPWSQVGPGWMLAMWSPVPGLGFGETPPPGSPTYQTATKTLYLVNPAGGRYPITTFPAPGDAPSPSLVDWSGDGARALFTTQDNDHTVLTQVDLRSGSKSTFTVEGASATSTPRYTRPDGTAVLVETRKALERVDLAGNHQLTYRVGPNFHGYLATPDGAGLVLGTDSGLALMGNDGVAGRTLPIAGQKDCTPMRWWDAGSTIALARCSNSAGSQLWLVPIDGGKPTGLTAPNNGSHRPDYGDVNAWQLPSGTYVQALGACGVVFLAKLNADGTTSKVSVPEVHGATVVVIGANGGDLDLQAKVGCGGGQSLIDYNPATNTSTVLLGPSVNGGGVISAKPYPGRK